MTVKSYASNGNRDTLNNLFSAYLASKDQTITVKGPVPNKHHLDTVLHGVLEATAVMTGYTDDFAFGGLLTEQSIQGWTTTNGRKIRGAYSNVENPVSVPFRLTRFDAVARPHESFEYSAKIGILDLFNLFEWFTYDCTDNWHILLSIGEGMWKDDASKTYVDIEADSKGTFFAIMSPPDQYEGSCFFYEFDCCFAAGHIAHICHENRDLYADSDNQLDQAYIHMEVEGDATMLLDYKFEVNLTVSQDFFPLFFGYEVYTQGFGDMVMACHDIEF